MQFTCDPTLKPGQTVLAAPRATAGPAYAWEPGGDPEAYVQFVGPEHLAVVDGQVYARMANGALVPHKQLTEPHVVIRPVGGNPIYLTGHAFTTEWATLDTAAIIADADAKLTDALARAEQFQAELAEAKVAYQIDNGEVIATENAGHEVPPPSEASEAGAEAGSTPAPAAPKRTPKKPKDA